MTKHLKYYSRIVTHRESINRFGKIGYMPYCERVKTYNIDRYNKHKRIRFEEDSSASTVRVLKHAKPDSIECERLR